MTIENTRSGSKIHDSAQIPINIFVTKKGSLQPKKHHIVENYIIIIENFIINENYIIYIILLLFISYYIMYYYKYKLYIKI